MNIIITGGTRGIGLSHAVYLSKKGHNLALIDISRNAGTIYGETNSVDDLVKQLSINGSKNKFYKCDLTNFLEAKNTFNKIINDFGQIDGCVLNVGGDVVGQDSDASGGKAIINNFEIDEIDHDAVFNRNYKTTLNSLKSIVPHFKDNKFGKIVTTSSASANYGVVQETTYSVSKAAVAQLTRSVAAEVRAFGVNVNCIAPGASLSGRFNATLENRSAEDREKILSQSNSILLKPAEPEYISSVVNFLLSEEAQYISGQIIRIDGGQSISPI
ncbi:SDR family NAD(P)-dependent oxidoreductase [Candidatus Pseudothioglobus sp. Uisw_050_01]|uniref:SDR family NAD(P)-dependent oxidoreductase n=1 Tax=Candidatus Pseudothioglobus sp. Uisw_050_01 TaxID=3230997 RepID=UPI003A84E41F